MPIEVVIRTKKSRKQVLAAVVKIVRTELVAYGVQNTLRENMKDFIRKSQGGADRSGSHWKKLAATTIARKLRKANKATLRGSRRKLRTLRTKFLFGPKTVARGTVPINIEFQDMVRSLQPGKISNGRYLAPSKQSHYSRQNIHVVETKVKHAKFARQARPIIMPHSFLVSWMGNGMKKNADKVALSAQKKL